MVVAEALEGASTLGEGRYLVDAGDAVGVRKVGAALEECVHGFGAADALRRGEEGGGAEGRAEVGEGGVQAAVEGRTVGGGVGVEVAFASDEAGLIIDN